MTRDVTFPFYVLNLPDQIDFILHTLSTSQFGPATFQELCGHRRLEAAWRQPTLRLRPCSPREAVLSHTRPARTTLGLPRVGPRLPRLRPGAAGFLPRGWKARAGRPAPPTSGRRRTPPCDPHPRRPTCSDEAVRDGFRHAAGAHEAHAPRARLPSHRRRHVASKRPDPRLANGLRRLAPTVVIGYGGRTLRLS